MNASSKLETLLEEGQERILADVLANYDTIFGQSSDAISGLHFLLSMENLLSHHEIPPAQRLIAFAILCRHVNASSPASTSLSFLLAVACDERAEKYERAVILGLLDMPISPFSCTKLLSVPANEYVRLMKPEFDPVQLPSYEEVFEKIFGRTPTPNDISKDLKCPSKRFDGDRAEAASGITSSQWIWSTRTESKLMQWMDYDMDNGQCSDTTVLKGSDVREKQEEEITDAQNEAPPATSTDSDLFLHSTKTNNKEIPGEKGELNILLSDKIADAATDECESLIPNERLIENLGSSGVGDTVQYHEEPEKHLDLSEASHVPMQFENETEDSLPTQSLPISHVNKPHRNISMSDAETIEVVSSSPANAQKTESVENNTSIEPDSKPDTIVCSEKEPEASSGNITGESAKIVFGTVNVEEFGDTSDGNPVISHGNLTLKENEHTEICKINTVSGASSGLDEVCKEELSIKPATNPSRYLVRVPRFDDESLKERIKLQERKLDEQTQQRDDIRVRIQETKKAIDQSHGVNVTKARNQNNSSWNLVRSKRDEMDSLQPAIDKVTIDQQIRNMEYKIQHESMPLKEEKQLIHELKQQKQLRKQLSSNIGSHDDMMESREQLQTLEERMKSLKKKHAILIGNAKKAKALFVEAERKYDVEYKKVHELEAHYRVADDSQQEAYNQLKSLRKELKEKNKHFYKFKDNETAAYKYARNKNSDTLHSHCKNQVENFMELWNNNDKFRKEYVTFNAKSTVRRLGTLDGRKLGPNDKPPIIQDHVPSYVDQKVHNLVSTPAKIDSASKTRVLELENGISEEKTDKKLTKSKGKASAKDKDAAEERRREDEAKLKEKLRLEQIAKAQEARERKKRKEEQGKRRAELRAQKEAEQKEKEREKRLRKKENKKALTGESSNPAPMSENTEETAQEALNAEETSICQSKSRWVIIAFTLLIAAMAYIVVCGYL